ncbi:hypothetical protein [Pseudohongiella spirulinae]|uniref:Uncharacterized protein n=1 Tax=Pseudohongiella spirulinae TaxID=1249552 RepID=A0A0S2KH11_9GAMM|nr:hypothetical protein [Pseudohongiella spirulinae]ALO47406.1 hypothetical protein PS2015_2774 [Pseudohongiella spirulinae]
MNRRRFFQVGLRSAAVIAGLSLEWSRQQSWAQNKTHFDKDEMFRGFLNNDDLIFQGFAHHAFHNGWAPRIIHPDGGYTYFIDSFVGYMTPESARVSVSIPRIEPGYWLVAVKLDEIYNTGVDVERFRGKRLDVFDYAIETNAKGELATSTNLSPEMQHFIHGIKAFMDKYSTTSRHSDRSSISDENIERHFMASIFFAAYRNNEQGDAINQAVEEFMSSSVSQRDAMTKDVYKALEQLGAGDNTSTDPDDAYNRQYVASWSSYVLGTKLIVMLREEEKGVLLETNIEAPLRQYVARIRPCAERGEPVLKI